MFSEELKIPFDEPLKFLLKRIQEMDSSNTSAGVIWALSSIYEMLYELNKNKADKTLPSINNSNEQDTWVREDVTQQIGRNCTLSAPGNNIISHQTWKALIFQKNREIKMLREEVRRLQKGEWDDKPDHTLKHKHKKDKK